MDKLENKKRLFFALCNELGLNKEEFKQQTKDRFNIKSFKDIQEYQLDVVIDELKK